MRKHHRQEQFQAFDRHFFRLRLPAIKPQDAKRQRGIDRRLRLLRVYAQNGKPGLTPPKSPRA